MTLNPAIALSLKDYLLYLLPAVALFMIFKKKRLPPLLSGTSEDQVNIKPENSKVEKLSWKDLIIDDSLKEEINSVIHLLKEPAIAKRYGIEVPKGILLSGPPGTGKTTIAKAIANEAGLSFFVLKLNEIISKWVGDSEKNLSALFEAAQRHAPAVIFIDEIDSIGKQRNGASGQAHRETFLNHLLQLMDGVVKSEGVYVVAATNRPDLVDAALKRPGRLNKVIEVGLPSCAARLKLFGLYLANLKIENDIDVDALAEITRGKSPATIRGICNQAGLNAFKRELAAGKRTYQITFGDMERALGDYI